MLFKNIKYFTYIGLSFTLLMSDVTLAKTPRDVYAEVDLLVQDINALREKNGVSQKVRSPGVQIAKTPLHVYTKGIEILDKVNRYRQANGLPLNVQSSLPQKNVVPAMVHELVVSIRKTLTNSNNPSQHISMDKFPLGITPSDVYEYMWYASYLMDGLAGTIKPNLVYRNVERIELSLEKLARKMGVRLNKIEEASINGKKPIDVNIEAFKVLFKIALLEKKLGVSSVRVPSFPSGNITPSDVYDTTNNIIAELVRINIKLNLVGIPEGTLPNKPISPNNVYAKVQVVSNMLDQLIN